VSILFSLVYIIINNALDNNETKCNFSKFMAIPNEEQERECYKAFYDATSNAAIQSQVCAICTQEWLSTKEEQASLLLNPSIREILMDSQATRDGRSKMIVLNEHLERPGLGEITCWMCSDCK
jgi:hypothetical protein